MELGRRLRDDFGIEILVAEAGAARQEHFGDCETRAIAHHFGTDPAVFDRPDRLAQPGLERHVVREAPKQRHCGVRMGIDEPGNQHVPRPLDEHPGPVSLARLGGRQDRLDAALGDGNGMIGEDLPVGFDGYAPVGKNQCVAGLHSVL